MKSPDMRKNVGQGQNAEKLSCNRNNQAVYTVSQSLKYGTGNDAVAGKQEAEADGA